MPKFSQMMVASLFALATPALPAFAAEPAAAPAAAPAAYSTETDLGTLLDNAQTKAVLDKYIHEMISNPQIDMARSMTPRQLQAYAGDALTNEKLAELDAELAKVPAAK